MTAAVVVDRDGIVTAWSVEAEQLLAYPARHALGRPMDFFIPEEERAGHWAGFRRTIESGLLHYGPSDILDVEMINSDGARMPIDVSIAPQRNDQGGIVAITATLRLRK
jgi:PAS domain S-box-containing protein